MKKIISLLLCIVLSGLMLVSCADDEIGSYLPNYDYTPPVVEDLTLNMYIITDDTTAKNAEDTVAQMINSYTTTEFHTALNVHYLTAVEYSEQIMDKVNATDNTAANIVLINSKAMFSELLNAGKLADLTGYLYTDKYGTLNVQIPEALLAGSAAYYYTYDEANAVYNLSDVKNYVIPNNRVIGNYEYLVINKELATQTLNYSPEKLAAYTSLEDAAELIAKIKEYKGIEDVSAYVRIESGMYEDKARIEAAGNVCNIASYPSVTPDVAFSSAFAIINREEKLNERAMEIIYAINTDTYLRNLLQYGVKGTNYSENIDTNEILRITEGDNCYSMNILYTGDAFKAQYCSALGWNKYAFDNGALQNKESVIASKYEIFP